MNGPLTHADATGAFLPAALTAYDDLVRRGLDHTYILHRRSSQAFGLNLFAPLDADGLRAIFRDLDCGDVEAPKLEFEYSDPKNRLGEGTPPSPHTTQVDVLMRGRDASGSNVIALIEVKFTEIDFSHCSAFANPANPDREVCREPGLFGGHPDRCFQIDNHGHGHRRYFEAPGVSSVVPPAGIADGGGCWVRRGLNQPMRNLALAHTFLADGDADRVVFAVCAPSAHEAMWRRFAEFRAAFPDVDCRWSLPLPAERVATHHPDGGAAIAALYPLPSLQWSAPATGSAAAAP
jgi:hypothetical protein